MPDVDFTIYCIKVSQKNRLCLYLQLILPPFLWSQGSKMRHQIQRMCLWVHSASHNLLLAVPTNNIQYTGQIIHNILGPDQRLATLVKIQHFRRHIVQWEVHVCSWFWGSYNESAVLKMLHLIGCQIFSISPAFVVDKITCNSPQAINELPSL